MRKKRDNRLTIGVLGTEKQIRHVIPVLSKDFNVVDLQAVWGSDHNRIRRIIDLITGIKNIDVLYNIYTSPFFWKKADLAHFMKKKVITHWIGSDTIDISNGRTDYQKLKNVDAHLVCYGELALELDVVGIKATEIPIIPFEYDFSIANMPVNHAVLIYMPTGKEEFYGLDYYRSLFSDNPSVIFNIVGNNNVAMFEEWDNVNVLGNLTKDEMESIYADISVVIRMPKHDGLSMSVLEAMAKGKTVIWNHHFECCHYAATKEDLNCVFKRIIKSSPIINREGHEYIVNTYSAEEYVNKFKKVLGEIGLETIYEL